VLRKQGIQKKKIQEQEGENETQVFVKVKTTEIAD
jgi:hypothetical protein